ncbi:MAG: VIT1/CCC1 transporter family protein [Pseudomonadota bacterium]
MNSPGFNQHLRSEHRVGNVAAFLKEIVYGGNDGIVTTFAVVAGFAGAGAEGAAAVGTIAVLLFGLANLLADATAMGLGAFLSSRSERDVYMANRAKELYEIEHNAEFERAGSIEILMDKGVSQDDAHAFADLYQRNPELMADFLMQYALGMTDPREDNPAMNGLATFIAFILFGAIPLIPYFLLEPTVQTFHASVAATALALVLLGTLRWYVTRENLLRSVGETVLVGGTCAIIAYAVGLAFSG